jgi:hypothetical protein
LTTGTNHSDIDMLAAVLALVAHSQIVVARRIGEGAARSRSLPAGYNDVDLAVLEWIAAEGRRLHRGLARQ